MIPIALFSEDISVNLKSYENFDGSRFAE